MLMSPLDIDGAQQSGSGTIVRHAVALAALCGRPVRVFNARKRRRSPGLRPQHVTSILACAEMCGGDTEGVTVDSTEFTFVPGSALAGGTYSWNISTAGSATMLVLSVLPLACFADRPVRARIEGGVFQDHAPSPYHLQHVLAPLLQRMGVAARLKAVRPGYVPQGAGVLELTVTPVARELPALTLAEPGVLREARGVALASHLADRRVSDRMASACEERLAAAGVPCAIERVYDTTAQHAGASLAVWGEDSAGSVFGADRAGAVGRSSEAIGAFVARRFLQDVRSGATVDRHVADQLVLFAAVAQGTSRYIVPLETDHLTTNLWLIGRFGARGVVERRQVVVDGLRLTRARAVEGAIVRQPTRIA
jgi:RNA 3'-terminal phosphate cyclase (ATP)